MGSSSSIDIDLHLQNIDQLFVDPELNPFENPRLQISGVEEAVNQLRIRKKLTDKIRLNIYLPSSQIDSDRQIRTIDALAKYCDFKINQNRIQLELGRAEGWRSVMIGMVFVAICLSMITAIYFLQTLNDTEIVIFAGFFTILVWMAIWNPAETFLYGLQPFKLEIRNYKALKNAEVMIKEET
jgi:hypothetical protein